MVCAEVWTRESEWERKRKKYGIEQWSKKKKTVMDGKTHQKTFF